MYIKKKIFTQEILRLFEISPGGKNCQLWNELPQKIQRMIVPLLTSHYTPISANNDVEFTAPIYGYVDEHLV